MRHRVVLFGGLVATQVAHSIEEYSARLWDVLPPARFISGLFSDDLSRGFLIFNLGVVVLGILCLAGPVAHAWPSARPLVWAWSGVEMANGIGHLGLSLVQRGYYPGALTAPILFVLAVLLMRDLRRAA